jgi:hypothetical protein
MSRSALKPVFQVQADTNRILIGEQIRLELQAVIPEDAKVIWPFLADSLASFEIVKKGTLNEEMSGGQKTLTQEIFITSFDSGYAFIPAINLQVGDQRLESQAIGVLINIPVVEEVEDYYDIKEPIDPPLNWPLIIGLILFLIGIGAVIYWVIGRLQKRKHQAVLPPEESVTPYEWARMQLEQLREEQLWQNGKVKEYYSRVTDIMRRYIERQMGHPAMESTAYEVVEIIRSLKPGKELMAGCESLMELSIGVKYAKQTPSESDHHRALATLEDFLEEYKPKEEQKEDVPVSV